MKKTCVADDSMEGNDPFMLFLLRSRKTTLTKLGERAQIMSWKKWSMEWVAVSHSSMQTPS